MKYQDASTALDTHIKSKKNLSVLEARQLILAEMKKAEEERRYLSYKEYDNADLLDCESLLKQKEIVVKIIVREGELFTPDR
jgi:hypothetical protein